MFHVEHLFIEMKKSVILLIVFPLLSACFYTHKAKRIDRYELTTPKKGVVKLTAYTFQFTGNRKLIEPIIHGFFNLKLDSPIYNFETKNLVDGEKVEVYLTANSDADKTFGVLDVYDVVQNKKDEDFDREYGTHFADDKPRKNRNKPIQYFHIQVMGEKGEDLLAEHTLKKRIVLTKLDALRRQLNH